MQPDISSFIEFNILKPATTLAEVKTVCGQVQKNNFAALCVPPIFIKKAKEYLQNPDVKIATVVGFPFGYSAVEAKVAETVLAIIDGADELNILINTTALKNNDWQYLAHELNAVLSVIKAKQKVVKIIIEAALLSEEEIIKCCDLYGIAGVDFIETSTGFSEQTVDLLAIVSLIRKHLADAVGIKATGNINNPTFAHELITAGATRIGCNSGIEAFI